MYIYTSNSDLTLTLLELRHADDLFDLIDQNRDHLRPRFSWVDETLQVEDVAEFITGALEKFIDEAGLELGIYFKHQLIGVIGLPKLDLKNHSAEIGYWLDQTHQGQGFATNACQALVSYLFTQRGIHRLEIKAVTDNAPSRKIPTRLGFTHEATLRQAQYLHGHYHDLELYALLATDPQK